MKSNEIKASVLNMTKYFLVFLFSILFWEIILGALVLDGITGIKVSSLFFVPAEALFFCLFTGNHKKKVKMNAVIATVILVVLCLYYISELLYFKQFGSLYSVSMIRMGTEAATGFWWAFKKTLADAVLWIVVMLIPVILSAGYLFIKEKHAAHTGLFVKAFGLLSVVLLWLLAIAGIRLFGEERNSPYYVLKDEYADTDISQENLGMFTTFVLESAYGVRGHDEGDTTIEITYTEVSVEAPVTEEPKQDEPEDIVDEIPVIFYHENSKIDFDTFATRTEDKDVKALCDYFSHKSSLPYNEYTGLFEGCNLIYICAESFTTYAMNELVTPTLCKMANNGIVLGNYYTSFYNTTTNGEFSFLTSLWPDVSRKAANGNAVGSFACSATNYMPYGLGTIFENIDVPTHAYHGYVSTYYRRCDSWPNLGFKTMKFMNEGLKFKNKWSPGDTELMEQTVSEYVNKDRFFTYYMTYSGHGAYTTATYMYLKNNKAVREALTGSSQDYTDSEISYYCGNYELDKAMEYLLSELEKAGKLENTVIVLAGDHVPYNMTYDEMEGMCKKAGLPYDKDFELYHSTCMIYKAGMEPIYNDEFLCTVDVLPTVLNLFGIDYDSRMIMGIDVFSEGLHRARLKNGNLITEYVNYNSKKDKATWKADAKNWSEEEKKTYLDTLISYSDNEYMVSLKMMEKDFYRFIQENIEDE